MNRSNLVTPDFCQPIIIIIDPTRLSLHSCFESQHPCHILYLATSKNKKIGHKYKHLDLDVLSVTFNLILSLSLKEE